MDLPSVRPFTSANEVVSGAALERGEILCFPTCPFPLAGDDDRQFLREQQIASSFHKNICYDPHAGHIRGFARRSSAQTERLRALLADFSRTATAWLAGALPRYASGWEPDRATLRTEEEATRRLRLTARNDLLHLDAFATRPSRGRRILRLYVNLNPTEPRIWITSEGFTRLLEQYGQEVLRGLGPAWVQEIGANVLRLFQPGRPPCSPYDQFMRRFHHFLKTHDDFQEKAPRRFWRFPPGSAWLVFTDGLSHAELRGQHALEHSYFIDPRTLELPELAPAAILQRTFGAHLGSEAA